MNLPTRCRSTRGAALGLTLLALSSCSSSSPSSPDDGGGDIRGRIAWSAPAGASEEIFVADMVVTAAGKAAGPEHLLLQESGPGAYTVRVGNRTLKVHSVVFRDGAGRSARVADFAVSDIRQVTDNGFGDFAPAINPANWDQVFYHSPRGGSISIFSTDLATGRETPMFSPGTDPNLDLEGQILYSDKGIWRYDIASGRVEEILDGTVYDPVPLDRGGRLLIFFNSPSRWTGQPFSSKANFVVDTQSRAVHKITGSTMKEDNPSPSPDGTRLLWHGWPDGTSSVYYGRLEGFGVPSPVRIGFRDAATGAPITGNCWYATWVNQDTIMFQNEYPGKVYISDLQGNARETGLTGSEISFVE